MRTDLGSGKHRLGPKVLKYLVMDGGVMGIGGAAAGWWEPGKERTSKRAKTRLVKGNERMAKDAAYPRRRH